MKKQVIFTFSVLALSWASGLLAKPTPKTTDDEATAFEKMIEGSDFEKLLKEVEAAMEKADKEGGTAAEKPILGPPKIPSLQPSFPEESAAFGSVTPPTTQGKKDQRSLLLEPTLQTIKLQGGKSLVKPTDEAFYAYQGFMDTFINHLTSIGNKVTQAKTFSPAFKETFAAYCQDIIDTLVVAHEQIESKKIYTQLLLAPPESNKQLVAGMKQLRNLIVNAAEAVKKIDAQIAVAAKEEEQETSIETLRSLAEKAKVEQASRTEQEPAVKKIKKHHKKHHLLPDK